MNIGPEQDVSVMARVFKVINIQIEFALHSQKLFCFVYLAIFAGGHKENVNQWLEEVNKTETDRQTDRQREKWIDD